MTAILHCHLMAMQNGVHSDLLQTKMNYVYLKRIHVKVMKIKSNMKSVVSLTNLKK